MRGFSQFGFILRGRSMPKFTSLLAGAAISVITALPSTAATVSDNVTFSASGFAAPFGGTPAATVSGSFALTFDPTQTYTDSTSGIMTTSLSGIVNGYPLAFDYNSGTTALTINEPNSVIVTVQPGELIVGGSFNGAGAIQYSPSTNDFYFQILNFTTAPTVAGLGYTQTAVSGDNLFYTTSSSTLSVGVSSSTPPSAPEIDPASATSALTLLLGGLAVLWGRRPDQPASM
jgi:hypothetical protein